MGVKLKINPILNFNSVLNEMPGALLFNASCNEQVFSAKP